MQYVFYIFVSLLFSVSTYGGNFEQVAIKFDSAKNGDTNSLPPDTSFVYTDVANTGTLKPRKQLRNDPYLLDYTFLNGTPNWQRLGNNSILVGGTAILAMGILYLAPESFTNWDKNELKPNKVFGKWWRNVSGGLVIDADDFVLNWVAHPYCGAVYYMTARSAGFNVPLSFSYSFALSTFFWEIGIEALAERPSLQDVIITPGIGAVLGEVFYISKRAIVANDYKLGCKFFGHLATFLMDPLNEIMDCIQGTWHKKDSPINLIGYTVPQITANGKFGLNFSMQLNF